MRAVREVQHPEHDQLQLLGVAPATDRTVHAAPAQLQFALRVLVKVGGVLLQYTEGGQAGPERVGPENLAVLTSATSILD